MTSLVRFERPVVIQIGRHSPERAVFDVNDAASILLRIPVVRRISAGQLWTPP
jgi:hypothetical protein